MLRALALLIVATNHLHAEGLIVTGHRGSDLSILLGAADNVDGLTE